MDYELKRVEDEFVNCIKCGFCRSVCPIFASLGVESSVARGKMGLMEAVADGSAIVTPGFADKMSLCLMCKACVANCPSGVRVDRAVMAARALAARRKGQGLIKRIIFRGVLKPKHIMNLGMGVGSKFQGLFMKPSKRKGSYKLRVPYVMDPDRVIPQLAARPLRTRKIGHERLTGPKAKVAMFTGCLLNYVYADMGEAVVRCFRKLGVDVIIPREQQCCGLPALVNGDAQTAADLAKAGVELFSHLIEAKGLDGVVVACASCGSCLKNEWEETLRAAGDGFLQAAEAARQLSERIYDVSEYLVDILGIDKMDLKLKHLDRTVTYHDPCHLNRGQGVATQPRSIMNLIPGIKFIEMTNPDRCCGGAGSFSLAHYDLSMDINAVKAEDIAGTGAKVVVTGCPGCIMHMSDGLHRKGMDQPVVHTLQLLDEALS